VLKCASVYTYEIDDPEIALKEITEQLNNKIALMKNSVGIVMCNPEYIHSGTLRYICENLPFDVAGVTTSSQAVNDEAGELILTLFVMSGDDVWFRTGMTGSVAHDIRGPLEAAYKSLSATETEEPKLALIFPPLLLQNAGDSYIFEFERLIPGVPIFGTIAIDDTLVFDASETIYNGKNSTDGMPFVLCYGNIAPRFFVATLHEDKVMPYKGEITSADGPFVHEINNINAYQYFEDIGFASNGALADNYLFVPFVIDLKKRDDYDGIPVIRGHASFTEDGSAIFRGNVDEGSTFTLLTTEADDVLSTTCAKIDQVNELSDVNGVLMFPCIVRRMMTMRINPVVELETTRKAIRPDIPFMMGYAGGEICPTSVRDGTPANRFHNYSLVILIV